MSSEWEVSIQCNFSISWLTYSVSYKSMTFLVSYRSDKKTGRCWCYHWTHNYMSSLGMSCSAERIISYVFLLHVQLIKVVHLNWTWLGVRTHDLQIMDSTFYVPEMFVNHWAIRTPAIHKIIFQSYLPNLLANVPAANAPPQPPNRYSATDVDHKMFNVSSLGTEPVRSVYVSFRKSLINWNGGNKHRN